MTDAKVLDAAFQVIMRRIVATGQAPHYTELGAALGYSVASTTEGGDYGDGCGRA